MPERGPLDGVTVVELCQNVAGPYAGFVLGALGARVVKVERPGSGDDTRGWGPPFWSGDSVMFMVVNAGKASVALDLTRDEDRAALLRLVDDADVVLASWRPGSLERLHLGGDELRARNPRLVHCSITGFGTSGPLAGAPGYDPLVQAFCGLMALTGEDGGGPVRAGTSVVDMGTGLWAALAVLAALRERDRTGKGVEVTGSLLETGLAWVPYQMVGYLATGVEPQRMGTAMPMLVPYQAFPTQDTALVVAAGNDALWQRLCVAIGREDLAARPELATNQQRVAARDRVVEELSRTFRARPAAEWEKSLRDAGVPCSGVQSVAEALEHPQTEAVGLLAPVPHPRVDGLRLPGLPFSLDGRRPRPASAHPDLGASPAATSGA